MVSLNFLYYSLGVGFLVLVGFISYAFYSLSQTFKESTSILTKVNAIAKDAEDLKNIIKNGILNLINMFSKKKGGDKIGKK